MKEYLIVDGYNIIFAIKELKDLSKVNIDSAKDKLKDMLADFDRIGMDTAVSVIGRVAEKSDKLIRLF